MSPIAGVVVLYNPNEAVIDNIQSYIQDIEILFVVDNSEIKNVSITETLCKNPKIQYIDNKGNQGIAHALNVGAKKAIELGYKWLLTMDQDSRASENMIAIMKQCYNNHTNPKQIGIISPYHSNKFYPISQISEDYSTAISPMTSGNLLSLDAFVEIGPFEEKLFIDHVDTEYSLRLKKSGFELWYANRAILYHNVGELGLHRFLWKTLFSTNHSPIRKYYVFRNAGYILEKHCDTFPYLAKKIKDRYWIDPIIVLLYEKQKFAKLKMMLRGYLDYKRGIFGKYHD
jgi:rhamnosyltransferase